LDEAAAAEDDEEEEDCFEDDDDMDKERQDGERRRTMEGEDKEDDEKDRLVGMEVQNDLVVAVEVQAATLAAPIIKLHNSNEKGVQAVMMELLPLFPDCSLFAADPFSSTDELQSKRW